VYSPVHVHIHMCMHVYVCVMRVHFEGEHIVKGSEM